MFILNIKINKMKFIKVFAVITIILVLLLFIFTIKKVLIPASKNSMLKINVNANAIENNQKNNNSKNDIKKDDIADNKSNSKILEINSNNFTTFLKNCNENIDIYVGKTVHISGFVYRLSDFTKNQFVVARLMPIHYESASNVKSDDNCVVVGILCEGNTLSDFKSNSWVDITGKIEVGNYKGKIPIINVNSVKQIESNPNELFVEQPQ